MCDKLFNHSMENGVTHTLMRSASVITPSRWQCETILQKVLIEVQAGTVDYDKVCSSLFGLLGNAF